MNIKKIISPTNILIVVMGALIIGSFAQIKKLNGLNERLSRNQGALLNQKKGVVDNGQPYKVVDSLNATKISQLELTLEQYEKHNAENLALIKKLKIKESNLESIISMQLSTITSISAALNDSLRYTQSNTDTLKCFTSLSKWHDITGCIDLAKDSVSIQIENRESLKVVETTIYKRFLGFLWRTNKIKDRQVDVISNNPHTNIVEIDYVRVER